MHFKFRSTKSVHSQRGFGLIELLVSMSIMAIVSAVVLVKHGSFNGAVLLRNMTYEVAYTVRQAQLLAVSSTDAGGGDEQVAYGVSFNIADGTYFIFRDFGAGGSGAPNDTYEVTDPRVSPLLRLDQRFEFGPDTQSTIIFRRPNFDARLPAGDGPFPVTVDVRLRTAEDSDTGTGAQRSVEILSTGNISVRSNP